MALSEEVLDGLATQAWAEWFGDAVQPVDTHRWVNDHHLYLAGDRHTGFVYQFAWFAAMGLMRLRQREGERAFEGRYRAFLSGMHAGDVAGLMRTHFDVDLAAPDFWSGALALVSERVDRLEACLDDATS